MNESMKTQGFSQGIYAVSASKKEKYGQLRMLPDGRKFRYGCAGGTLVAGGMCIMAEATANHFGQVQTSGAANAVGSTQVAVYVAGTAITASLYDDGYLQVYRGTAGTVGFQYQIVSHTLLTGAGIVYLTLLSPIQVATVVGDYFSLIPNPWSSVSHSTAIAHGAAGVAMNAATTGQYLWLQTGGVACVKCEGNTALGSMITVSNTTQEVEVPADFTGPNVGFGMGYTGVAGYWCPHFLQID